MTDFIGLKGGYHHAELRTQLLSPQCHPQTLRAKRSSPMSYDSGVMGPLKDPAPVVGDPLASRAAETSPTVIQGTAGHSCIQAHCSSLAWNTGSDTVPFMGPSPASQAKGRHVLRLAWPYPSLTKQSPSLWWADSSIPNRGTCRLFSEAFPNWG